MTRPFLLLALLTLPAAAHALTGGEQIAAFVVSAMQDSGNPGGYNSGSSADDDGDDD